MQVLFKLGSVVCLTCFVSERGSSDSTGSESKMQVGARIGVEFAISYIYSTFSLFARYGL